MRIKNMLALCLALIMLLMFCSCGNKEVTPETEPTETVPEKLTAAQIVEKMQEAVAQTPCSKMDMAMDMTMSIQAGADVVVEFSAESSSVTTISQDPLSSYTNATVTLLFDGQPIESVTESYIVSEEGELVSYISANGVWTKAATGQSPDALQKATFSQELDMRNAVLDETVSQWNGKEAVCLNVTTTGDQIQDSLDTVMRKTAGAATGVETLDYSKLTCATVIYLDPVTYLPMAEEITIDGMQDMMAASMEELGAFVDVSECKVTATYLSFDPQPEIKVPEDIVKQAEAWTRLTAGEPDNGDGTFTIYEGSAMIDLVHPEGFEVIDKGYDHVTFRRDDYRQITYTMYYLTGTDTTGAAFAAENDSSEKRWNTNGGKVQREQTTVTTDSLTFTCDLLATTWSSREDANLYGWSTLGTDAEGTYYLYVEVTDGYNDGMGFSKSADITADEFAAYLNAASISKLIAN